jgi:signal transduction histidine kinase
MTRGIGVRLLASFLLLIALAMGLLCPYLLHAFRQFYLEWSANDLRARAMVIRDIIGDQMTHPEQRDQLDSFTAQFRREDRVIVRLLDGQGRVLGSTDPTDYKGRSLLDLPGIRLGLAGEQNTGRLFRGQPLMERLYVVVPVRHAGRVVGLVRVSLLLGDFKDAYRRMRNVAFVGTLVTFLGCGFLSLLISRSLVRPISRMSTMAARIGMGHLEERVAVRGPRELEQLGTTLNTMAGQLAEQERIRRDFLANASHEFRTPLSNVRVALETLIELPPAEPEVVDEMLQGAVGEIERLTFLVADLLDLARIQGEMGEPGASRTAGWQETPCRALIDPLVAAVTPRLRSRELRLEVAAPPDLWVTGSEPRLRQAIMNLLDNAIRCSPDGGRLRLRVARRGSGVEIVVADDGPGIPDADLPYIFDRFYTVNKARSRATSGTGLGLAITRSIMEAHGGSVEAACGPAGGSTFTLRLPGAGREEPWGKGQVQE